MAGHSPSKTGVNALMSRPPTPLFYSQDVDARNKPGQDDGEGAQKPAALISPACDR
jgi:hypothetical protein